MIERIVRFSVDNRATVVGLTGVAAAVALVVALNLRLDALPDTTGVQVVVLTRAPGLVPEEVELRVTRPIETAIAGLPGLESQRSISRYGLSSVTAVFEDGADVYRARQLVTERLAGLGGRFPEGVEPPELGPVTGGLGEIYHFTLSSPVRAPAELLELAEVRVAPLLRSAAGVVEVNTWGGARRTLDVVGDPLRMARAGVTLEDLREATRRAVGSAAGASLEAGAAHVLLRGVSLPQRPSDLADALVPGSEGRPPVRVGQVADVTEGALPRLGAASADGQGETIYVMVQMQLGANALQVLEEVHKRLPRVRAALPEDVVVREVYDRANLVGATLRTVGKNLAEGCLLVVLVLFAMLGSLRAGLLVSAVIPLAMLGALAGMVALGVPGNLMSLGALDFGLLVDGAVVLVEAVFHELPRKRGGAALPPDRAAPDLVARVGRETARPIFFSVLVILLVYVPILTLVGVEGKMFRPMAVTVVLALASALVLSMTFVPAAAALLLRPRDVPAREPLLVRLADLAYAPVLAWALRRPRLVLGGAALALAAGVAAFLHVGTTFVPQLDEGDLVIQTTRAPDASIRSALEEAARLEQVVRAAAPEVAAVVSRIGSPAVATDIMGLEQADVFVRLKPREQWRPGLTQERLVEELSRAVAAGAPGSDPAFTQPIQMRFNELLGGSVTDVALEIFGDDLEALRALATRGAEELKHIPGAEDVRVNLPPSVALREVRPRALDAARVGLDTAAVLDVVRALRSGLDAADTYDGALRVPVRVRLGTPPTAFSLEDALVPTRGGSLVTLSRVADVVPLLAPSLVSHDNGARRAVVGFNVRGRDLGSVVQEARARVEASVPLPRGYRAEWTGQYESLVSARARMLVIIPLVVTGILGLLWFLFQGLVPTLVIALNVPFAAVGGILALWARDLPLSVSASVGFVALSGIAVLNGVVLMARLLAERAAGAGLRQAAERAARQRLRPVLMTASVASLGFVPMMLATGVGAEVQRPLATVVVGGLFTSTLLTLVVIPALVSMLGRLWPSEEAGADQAPGSLAPEERLADEALAG